MDIHKEVKPGKSRLSSEQLQALRGDEPTTPKETEEFIVPKGSSVKMGIFFFAGFVILVVISLLFRMVTAPAIEPVSEDSEVEVIINNPDESDADRYGVVEISDVEIAYEEPERAFHIERRQQFCADNIDEARRLYIEYIGTRNTEVMKIKPRDISDAQWIKEKTTQGAYKENLGERETNYYYEYPTTGGNFVDLMRIHKCEVFNPGGRIIPIVSVDEDGYIPEYEMGYVGIDEWSEDDMVAYLQYLISLRHEDTVIENISKNTLGTYLTLTLDMNYQGNASWIKLKKDEEAYIEGQYKLDLSTGLLTYKEELLARQIAPSPPPEN